MSKHFNNSNIRPASPIVFKSGAPVSVVWVAATYTGVTYANNGGKVQLSSAGVHGLTAGISVGSNVYVSWASGTGISGLYNVNSVDDTTKITIDLTYVAGLGAPTVGILNTRLIVNSLPIPSLTANSLIACEVLATVAKTTNTKSIFAILNNTTAARASAYTSSSSIGSLRVMGDIKNQGNVSAQISTGNVLLSGSSLDTFLFSTINTASNSNTITIEVANSAANEVIKIEAYKIGVYL